MPSGCSEDRSTSSAAAVTMRTFRRPCRRPPSRAAAAAVAEASTPSTRPRSPTSRARSSVVNPGPQPRSTIVLTRAETGESPESLGGTSPGFVLTPESLDFGGRRTQGISHLVGPTDATGTTGPRNELPFVIFSSSEKLKKVGQREKVPGTCRTLAPVVSGNSVRDRVTIAARIRAGDAISSRRIDHALPSRSWRC